jgi:hypothetical protein
LPLSTASLLSARFTYVSPAALIDTHRCHAPAWIRLVDGGYFDNSGAVTAQEIARTLIGAHKLTLKKNPSDPDPPPPPRSMRVIASYTYPISLMCRAPRSIATNNREPIVNS